MKRWFKRAVALIVVAVLVACGFVAVSLWQARGPRKPEPIPIGDYSYAKALAQHRVERAMKQYHIPGVAIALIDDQEIVWQANFGLANVEEEIPVSEDTVFKLWSLSKAFTAVELMRLVEEGRVDLDAPITEYVPDFTIRSRFGDGEPITVRHLLTHRSGLPRGYCVKPEWYLGQDAVEHLAASLKDCYLAYPTGQRYKYSNAAYNILGYIIQAERGQAFPAYMRDRLLRPIGMSSSAFWSTELPAGSRLGEPGQAHGYEYYEGEQYLYEQYDDVYIASGNLYGTAGDLAEFVRFVFREGEADGEQLISPETLALMCEDQYSRPADPQPMGLGWKIGRVLGSEKMVWHDGGPAEGIGSLVAMLPEKKLGVVMLGNSTSFESSVSMPIAMVLLEAMVETAYGLERIEEESREEVQVERAVLERYQGEYALFGDIIEIVLDKDRLKARFPGFSFDLAPIGENRFGVTHWLNRLGLLDLLGLPMDIDELEIQFQPGTEAGQDLMIIDFGGINYEICPRYPEVPAGSEALAGRYERYYRLQAGNVGLEKLGENEIEVVDGRLTMSGGVGPILPIDDKTIIILSGPFSGETITRDPESGTLSHQVFVFKPITSPATTTG
jgi:CubicO group peptidase (beta-lactamase class C family)